MIWVVFLVSEMSHVHQGSIHILFVTILLVPVILRFLGWRLRAEFRGRDATLVQPRPVVATP